MLAWLMDIHRPVYPWGAADPVIAQTRPNMHFDAPDRKEATKSSEKLLMVEIRLNERMQIAIDDSIADIFEYLSPIFPIVKEKKIHPNDVAAPKTPKLKTF
ncbi:hypothetical protein [Candidatus Bathycorpusculum sp.]|uniref:hypothetical protein n=1 Tax=Candidatus Bathycorpusculum sp. TaxID=2994959 RepID=UPI0028347F72|nr:hypothetical protein [Candidatus Termitimicrobium sp.]MCL2685685.1 hypothetical protein [Candidatus Termitimicrobium sp.]